MGRLTSLGMAAGALVWAVHFMGSYGAVALLCARGGPDVRWLGIGAIVASVTALSAIALAALAFIAVRSLRGRSAFADFMTAGVAALAAVAIVWESWLVLRGPACA